MAGSISATIPAGCFTSAWGPLLDLKGAGKPAAGNIFDLSNPYRERRAAPSASALRRCTAQSKLHVELREGLDDARKDPTERPNCVAAAP